MRVALTMLLKTPETGAAPVRSATNLLEETLVIEEWTSLAPRDQYNARSGSWVLISLTASPKNVFAMTMMFRVTIEGCNAIVVPRRVEEIVVGHAVMLDLIGILGHLEHEGPTGMTKVARLSRMGIVIVECPLGATYVCVVGARVAARAEDLIT